MECVEQGSRMRGSEGALRRGEGGGLFAALLGWLSVDSWRRS